MKPRACVGRTAFLWVVTVLPSGGLGAATLPLALKSAEVAGEAVYPAPAAAAAVAWDLGGAVSSWRPGGGVLRASTGDSLLLVVGDSGGELISPELAFSASRLGRLVVTFGNSPRLAAADAVLTWTRASGTTEEWPVRLAVTVGPSGESKTEVDLETSLRWYGAIKTIAIHFPRTIDASPIAVRSIRLEPRRAPTTAKSRVEIKDFELAKEVSPFQARGGFVLPPNSRYELESAPAEVVDLRFGVGIVGPEGAAVIGSFDADYTATLTASVFAVGSEQELAKTRIPIVVQSSRWLDYTVPVRANGKTALRVVFDYRNDLDSTVVLVSKPRITTSAAPRTTVLTTVDALQKDHLSIYGYGRRSPGIDRVGRDGYVFTRAFSQANNTPTAIIALMNSEYPENAPWEGPRPGRPSLAQFLSDHSVYTVMVTASPFLQEPPIAAGFDEIVYVLARGRHTSEDVENAMTRVLRAHRGEDLLLYAHFLDPHAPYDPPLHTAGRYVRPADAQAEQMARNVDPWVYHEPMVEPGLNTNPVVPGRTLSPEAFRRVVDRYDEELLDVDIHVGNVWALMNDLGMYEEAMVIVSADHGEEFYEHGGVQHGGLGLYNEIVRVPLLIKPPRSQMTAAKPGSSFESLVQHLDLYPTIVEGMGLTPPPWIAGSNAFRVDRGYAISEWTLVPGRRRRAITDGEYKLITGEQQTGDGVRPDPPLLFELSKDPGETANLANQDPDRVALMQRKMLDAIAGSRDRAPY